jgi:hypothetical protein
VSIVIGVDGACIKVRLVADREIVLVTGKQGMGKTWWTRRYLRTRPRVIVLDPMREHDGVLFDDAAGLIRHVHTYHQGRFRVRSEWAHDGPTLAATAMVAGHCTLVLEEAQRSLPARGDLNPAIADVIYRGRGRPPKNLPDVTLVLVSQRPATVHIAARSQWTRLVIFKQTEGADTRWLAEQTPLGERAAALGPGEYFEVTPYSEEVKRLPRPFDPHRGLTEPRDEVSLEHDDDTSDTDLRGVSPEEEDE